MSSGTLSAFLRHKAKMKTLAHVLEYNKAIKSPVICHRTAADVCASKDIL